VFGWVCVVVGVYVFLCCVCVKDGSLDEDILLAQSMTYLFPEVY